MSPNVFRGGTEGVLGRNRPWACFPFAFEVYVFSGGGMSVLARIPGPWQELVACNVCSTHDLL